MPTIDCKHVRVYALGARWPYPQESKSRGVLRDPGAGGPVIGIIGPPFAGKTTYLKELKRALANEGWIFREQFKQSSKLVQSGPSAPPPPTTSTSPAVVTTRTPLGAPAPKWESRQHSDADWPDYLFPPKTHLDLNDPESSIEKSTYQITRGEDKLEFVFLDPPGEVFMQGTAGGAGVTRAREIVFGEMVNWEGLIVLLDLVRSPNDLREFWLNSVNNFRIQRNGAQAPEPLTIPTAVVLTKADQIPQFGRYRQPEAESWVKHHPAYHNLYQDIRANCKIVRFFFASATGWTDGMHNLRTQVIPPGIDDFLKMARAKQSGPVLPDPAVSVVAAGTSHHGSRHPILPPPTNVDLPPSMRRFEDPLQLASSPLSHDDLTRLENPYGILECPRRQDRHGHAQAMKPWNVAEPLLWTARQTT